MTDRDVRVELDLELDLDPARPRRVHVVGVGGAGMSAIAQVLAAMGHRVSGSDARPSPVLERLAARGVTVQVGHSAAHVAGADVVAVSTAVGPDNPEVVEARRLGIRVARRAEALAAVCAARRTAAISGTHGKTTTSSLLASALDAAGLRPSWIVGAPFGGHPTGARWADGDWLVVEADESDGTFVELPAEMVVVTSIEPDHLEHHGGFEGLVSAFDRFLAGPSGPALVCADDPVAAEAGARVGALTYGTVARSDYRLGRLNPARHGVRFELSRGDAILGEAEVPLPGRHNALNAAGALVAAMLAGAPFDAAASGIAAAEGVHRRFHLRGESGGVAFVDDYAHLPGEVGAALSAARDGAWERIVCVFQPHRYSRTEAMGADFGPVLLGADAVVVTGVYPAGEAPRPGVSGRLVADAVAAASPGADVAYVPERRALATEVARRLRPGDLCLILGAGDIDSLAPEVMALLEAR